MADADGRAGFAGYDMLTFDRDGSIANIRMVVDTGAPEIAWRRHNPVALEPTS